MLLFSAQPEGDTEIGLPARLHTLGLICGLALVVLLRAKHIKVQEGVGITASQLTHVLQGSVQLLVPLLKLQDRTG